MKWLAGSIAASMIERVVILWPVWIEGTSVRLTAPLLIEHVVILGSAAVDRGHRHEADRARRHPAGRRPVWIEGTGMRLTAPVWIEAPA